MSKVSKLLHKIIKQASSLEILSVFFTQENYAKYIDDIDCIIENFNEISTISIKNSERLEFLKQISRVSSIMPFLSMVLD